MEKMETDVATAGRGKRAVVQRGVTTACLAAALLPLLVPGLSAQQPAAARPAAGATTTMPAAPYVRPRVGTRYVYRGFSNVITSAKGWRVEFRDSLGRKGARIGLFISDNPAEPLTVERGSLDSLWPLRPGATTTIVTGRKGFKWQWQLHVVDTETVVVPAGRFLTYIVEGVQSTLVTVRGGAATNATTWWYAPEIGAVARVMALAAGDSGKSAARRAELLAVEAPAEGRKKR